MSDAALKLAFGLLIVCQIADAKGYAVAEAFLQAGSSKDDEFAKRLEIAEKFAGKDLERRAKRVVQSMVLVVGTAVVVTVVAGWALLVAGSGSGGSWQGSDAFGGASPQRYGPPQMPASSTPLVSRVLHGPSWPWASLSCEGHWCAGAGASCARQVLALLRVWPYYEPEPPPGQGWPTLRKHGGCMLLK